MGWGGLESPGSDGLVFDIVLSQNATRLANCYGIAVTSQNFTDPKPLSLISFS